MRQLPLAALLLSACLPATSAVRLHPALDVDGRHHAVRVTLAEEVPDTFSTPSGTVPGWRAVLGQALTDALRETFVVVEDSGPEVLELRVLRASPSALQAGTPALLPSEVAGNTGLQLVQIDYQARLEDGQGHLLARASGVVERAQPLLASMSESVGRAVEGLVRELGGKLLASLPADLPPSDRPSVTTFQDVVAGLPAPRRCTASALPEWRTASAEEKKALLERCR